MNKKAGQTSTPFRVVYGNSTSRYAQKGQTMTTFVKWRDRDGREQSRQVKVPLEHAPLAQRTAAHAERHPKDKGQRNAKWDRMVSVGHLEKPTWYAENDESL
mgnify:FL=1